MERSKPITFLSPVTDSSERIGPQSWGFLLLQSVGAPMELEYRSQDIATKARAALLKADNTYDVPTRALFDGIALALKQAFDAGGA